MPAVVVHRVVPTPVDRVWATLTDFADYGRWIPMTRMTVDPPPTRVGWGFDGRTGVGPAGFVDSMLVTWWQPPRRGDAARFAVRKTGRVLAGWADVVLTPRSDGGTNVVWREEIVLRPEPFGRLVAPLVDPVVARLFGAAVGRMLAAAAR